MMRMEALVLVGDQHFDETRIGIGDVTPSGASVPPPPHTAAAAGRRDRRTSVEKPASSTRGNGPERIQPQGSARERENRARTVDLKEAAHHRAAVTSSVPVPVRPKRSGRYMSST